MDNSNKNPPKISNALKTVDNKELKSTGFWLNQVFLVLSTVFGVYLAAQSGLEQALKFDTFSKMEDNYYLRTSLYDEVKDNADNLSKFAALLAKSPPKSELEYNKPTIEKYIWQTMQYSPTTLETPSEFLTQVRRFYSKSQFIIDAAINRKMSAKYASEELKKAVAIIENQTLPNLQSSAALLKTELSKNGIDIGTLKGNNN
ncbi:hypothetical protein EXT42_16470 [Pseudoalteromonas sp. CO302Y]|jgi:hypothetical protein|uniref:hypothetical protein n=1 Tax=Pseudoalteromonas TaxID=53246 RepID=UPI000781FA95|nr:MULTISPECIES: hypothetical protein [Pseudoalteromonas]MCF7517662.1 hypothetical protein [Pseudoalteromonas sp. L21]RZF90056.1 hypothetical protein EXT42_16470 [Pseudoalteromonas sp. CO302Y]RZG05856.1 hypothetical protein EXT40_16475 [Pseudoalteromonas sp. CO133X]UJX27453.1 hypothetical protein L3Q70_19600 [Pseudoalteromonas sp. CF6-2]|tara:strand:+ start:319 stop:924 length:606 start_codon:yes stop_codon:yes gene_type:complete